MIASIDRDAAVRTRPAGRRGQFVRAESDVLDQLSATRYSLFASRQAAYDAANQEIQFNAGSPNQTFDANGNLTTSTDASGTTTYTWDARNRMVAQAGPGVSATFQYDALGRRVSKTINGQTTGYLYDGNDIVQEIGGSAVGASYVRSLSIDEPFVRQASTGNEFYHVDALGSTLDLTNQTGAVQASYQYEAFGKTMMTGTSSNPFQYTGRENDGTGLYYYRARYLNNKNSRFLSEDDARQLQGINLTVAETINLYAYVNGSPINFDDPFGLYLEVPPDMQGAMQQVRSTARGKEIYDQLNDSSKTYTIVSEPGSGTDPYTSRYRRTIHIDPQKDVEYCIAGGGKGKASMARILAHEMGHLTGTINEEKNIRTNENPVAQDLNEPPRGGYDNSACKRK